MALGDPYISLEEIKKHVGIAPDNTAEDFKLTNSLASTTSGIEDYCGRQFNRAGVISARVYRPTSRRVVEVDDFHTATGLIVATDEDDDGVFETVWPASHYQLEPLNGVVNGKPGWPFWRIRSVGAGRLFPMFGGRATVQVSIDWGWAAIPAPVKEAQRIVTVETWKLPDAPFGVAGFAEFGAMRVRDNPIARSKLDPYRRDPWLGA